MSNGRTIKKEEKKDNGNEIKLADDNLLSAFSFLNKHDLTNVAAVNKKWKTLSSESSFWEDSIKPEYKGKLNESKISAKEFYIKNIDARSDTFYLVNTVIPVERKNIDLSKFAAYFNQNSHYIIFKKKSDAISYADIISIPNPAPFKIVEYAPVLTVRIKNIDELKTTELTMVIQKTELSFFLTKIANIEALYKTYYKAGLTVLGLAPQIELNIPINKSASLLREDMGSPRIALI